MKSNHIFFYLICVIFSFISCGKDAALKNIENTTTLNEASSTSASIRNEEEFTNDGIMPTVDNGILRFTDKDHLWNYIDFLEEDGDKYIEQPGDEEKADPYMEFMEGQLGYNSLTTKYNALEEIDENFKDNLDFHIGNPYYTDVFNEYNELWVGSDIYKYVGNGLVAIAHNNDVASILDMRGKPALHRVGMSLFDEYTKDSIKVEPRTDCNSVIELADYSPSSNTVVIKLVVTDLSGDIVGQCGGSGTIDWGDGTTSSISQSSYFYSHTYPEITINDCDDYTISVSFTSSICGVCGSGLPYSFSPSPKTVEFCGATCQDGDKDLTVWTEVFNNGNRRAIGRLGYETQNNLWHNAKVWASVRFYKKKNGNWKKRRPGKSMKVRIHGGIFTDCEYDTEKDYNKSEQKKKRKVKVKTTWNQDMHLIPELRHGYVDYEVFDSNSSTPDASEYGALNY